MVFGEISYLIPSEHGSLVGCNGLRNSKSMNDFFFEELNHIFLLCFLQGFCFYPFGEVVCNK